MSSQQPRIKLTLGFSPCPNDTFIFEPLVQGKIDTEGISFDIVMADVEDLNRKAFNVDLDITKLSYAAYAHLTDVYILSDAGSALGRGVGPILVSKKMIDPATIDENCKIAIPGQYTTANFLMSLAFPKARNTFEMLFSEIETAILKGKATAGLIIHENRFTYQERGLHKIIDLGEYWEKLTHAPIPLGGIMMKRTLSKAMQRKVNRLIRKSVEYALANRGSESGMAFVKKYAQEMSEDVINKHIDLYVNSYTVDLGPEGREAVNTLFDKAQELGVVQKIKEHIFLK